MKFEGVKTYKLCNTIAQKRVAKYAQSRFNTNQKKFKLRYNHCNQALEEQHGNNMERNMSMN